MMDDEQPFEQVPMFESLDAMCAALGWSDELKAQIFRDMEWTTPRAPGDPLH